VHSPAGATRRHVPAVAIRYLVPLLLAGAAMAQDGPLPPRPTVPLQVGTRIIHAEVVTNVQDRAHGLMHRASLAAQAGMLFVFDADADDGEVCMWMKNTGIPLSAAFLAADGRVINIVDMRPRSEQMHCAAGQAQYVLEVNQGIFAAAGVTPGVRVGGLPEKKK
jgi:uncharacterized protein